MRFDLCSGRSRQVLKSSSMLYRLVMGITSRRCSSLDAFRLTAMLTGRALWSFFIAGTKPTVETVIFRWLRFKPSSSSMVRME